MWASIAKAVSEKKDMADDPNVMRRKKEAVAMLAFVLMCLLTVAVLYFFGA